MFRSAQNLESRINKYDKQIVGVIESKVPIIKEELQDRFRMNKDTKSSDDIALVKNRCRLANSLGLGLTTPSIRRLPFHNARLTGLNNQLLRFEYPYDQDYEHYGGLLNALINTRDGELLSRYIYFDYSYRQFDPYAKDVKIIIGSAFEEVIHEVESDANYGSPVYDQTFNLSRC